MPTPANPRALGTTARTADRAGHPSPRRRTRPLHWLLFTSACTATSVSLAWLAPTLPLPPFSRTPAFLTSALAIPLALVLVPGALLRRITHRKPPKLAIGALVITLPAAIVLAAMAGPLEGEGDGVDLDPGANTGVIGGLAALTVVAGAWGCARLSRGDA